MLIVNYILFPIIIFQKPFDHIGKLLGAFFAQVKLEIFFILFTTDTTTVPINKRKF